MGMGMQEEATPAVNRALGVPVAGCAVSCNAIPVVPVVALSSLGRLPCRLPCRTPSALSLCRTFCREMW
jgi:hypothetical protein